MNFFDFIGYLGTILVMASFLSQSIFKLRILNAIGALLVTVYAIYNRAWPVALLDGFIVIINVFQLCRSRMAPKAEV